MNKITTFYDEFESNSNNQEERCPRFYTGEGCAEKDSYIQAFYDASWADIYSKLPAQGASDAEVAAFTEKYEDQFITETAMMNPNEDFAESFVAFVLKAKPEGSTIQDKKVRLFYLYSELVELRSQIRNALH